MLTARENARIRNFTSDMDEVTAAAMFALFTVTKPGCDATAHELMIAAHTKGEAVSASTIAHYAPLGLVTTQGFIRKEVKEAIRQAVAERFLVMHWPMSLALKPEIHFE